MIIYLLNLQQRRSSVFYIDAVEFLDFKTGYPYFFIQTHLVFQVIPFYSIHFSLQLLQMLFLQFAYLFGFQSQFSNPLITCRKPLQLPLIGQQYKACQISFSEIS